jgi:DNA-binding HxlR family transcriptional regulator
VRNTGVVRTYGQYCPIARGAEIFAERWTPLIIRNLYLGCGNFSEILEGAPGLSRTLLSERLRQLERLGVVKSAPKPDGRGHHYELTSAGHDLFKVCVSLGEWGARWLEIAPENLDPFVALWSMCHALRRDQLPDRRVVIRFDFTGRPHRERYWLLIELGDTEICKTCPGVDEDLYITADAEAFVKWHAGQLAWAKPPAKAASNSTAPRRWLEPSQRGTPAACSPTSGRPPVSRRAAQADNLDPALPLRAAGNVSSGAYVAQPHPDIYGVSGGREEPFAA